MTFILYLEAGTSRPASPIFPTPFSLATTNLFTVFCIGHDTFIFGFCHLQLIQGENYFLLKKKLHLCCSVGFPPQKLFLLINC